MTDREKIAGFPVDDYVELLQGAQSMFDTERQRENLHAGLGLPARRAEQQRSDDGGDAAALVEKGPGVVSVPALPSYEPASTAQFARELVDLVSQPAHLDAAVKLARRAIRERGDADADRWSGLIEQLEALLRRQRRGEGATPDLERYRDWIGFECRHQYSLTDRFFGREEYLAELDEWITNDNDTSVWCLCALGGGGKSALAWQWLSGSLTAIRQLRYEGAFWCSFYEKNFNFDEFLRRALAFAGRIDEESLPTARPDVEEMLLDVLNDGRFVFVLDGLERLMNGYATVATRAVDLEGMSATLSHSGVSRVERRLVDPRDGAFLRRLAGEHGSKILITTRLVPADLEVVTDDDHVPLPNAVFTDLPGLTGMDAAALWASIAPGAEITDDLEAIFRVCGYHPLVISILARSVNQFGGSWNDWLRLEAHRDFNPREATSEAGVRSHIIGICMRDLSERSYDILGVLTTTGKPMQLTELADVLLLGSIAGGDQRWTSAEQVEEQLDSLLVLGLIGKANPPDGATEYDVHPVVRGAAWSLLTDPKRERFLDHALSEFAATPDRSGPEELGALDRATALYRLLVQTGQLDRAWEMFATKLWAPLYRDSATRELLDLYQELLPDRQPLQLLPLTSRRAQADALNTLGDLLLAGGKGSESDTLLRWCGAIRLQIGDHLGFLNASHLRAWQTMYEGRLFDTEYSLRRLKLEAIAYGAVELRPALDCWIGIVLALRGEPDEAQAYFERARGRTHSRRWWGQGLAEGMVYLDKPDQALHVLEELGGATPSDGSEEAMQIAWEQLTAGMAHLQMKNYEAAREALSDALGAARRAGYGIIQCFAVPAMAEIELDEGNLTEAEDLAESYHELDPHDDYRLSAADAWRVRALCRITAGDLKTAREYATTAYRLAACDGPPFVYQSGLRRSLQALESCGAYVPRTDAVLDPGWHEQLERLDRSEREIEGIVHALRGAKHGPTEEPSFEDAMATIEKAAVMRAASDRDLAWWEEVTGSRSAIKVPLTQEMERAEISLETFREEFEASPQKSFAVVFRRLLARRTIHPHEPRPVRDLSGAELDTWLSEVDTHEEALVSFLETALAQRMRRPFDVHLFGPIDVVAFLDDHKRRIAVDADPHAKRWWDQLEQRRPPEEMLILAECVLRMPAELSEVVQEISLGTNMGLAYAFDALLMRRAIEHFESRSISKTEGWNSVEILLRLQDVKFQLGWSAAGSDAREFWDRLERENEHRLARVLRLAEELARRQSSIEEYHKAYLLSHTDDIQANLAYLDYERHRTEPWDAAGPWPDDSAGQRWAYETVRPEFTDVDALSADQISGRLEILLRRIGRRDLDEEHEEWWLALEQRVAPAVLLRLGEEIDERRLQLDQRVPILNHLRTAQIDGDTENMVAALAYLDFTILKRAKDWQAAERATEHNRIGNEHYREERYREAVASYLEAIEAQPVATYYRNLAGALEQLPDLSRAEAVEKSLEALNNGLVQFPEDSALVEAHRRATTKHRLAKLGGLPSSANLNKMLPVVTPIAVEVAGSLIPLVEGEPAAENLLARIPGMRDRIKDETGVRVPGVRFRGNETDMPLDSYLILLDEVPMVMDTVTLTDGFTTMPQPELEAKGIEARPGAHPADRRSGHWIALEDAAEAEISVSDAKDILVQHLDHFLRHNLSPLTGLQEIVNMLDGVWSPAAREIRSDRGRVARFMRMVKALLDELVPLTELEAICLTFVDHAETNRGMDDLCGAVRALPKIRPLLPGNDRGARLVRFDHTIERDLLVALRPLGGEFVLAIEPEFTQDVLTAVRETLDDRPTTLIVEDPLLRRYARRLVELEFPGLHTLSTRELLDGAGRPTTTITLE